MHIILGEHQSEASSMTGDSQQALLLYRNSQNTLVESVERICLERDSAHRNTVLLLCQLTLIKIEKK